MDVSVSVSFFQDELASTIEHAVKAAVDTVLCQITKVVGGKFTEFRMEMAGKEKENESLKLRLEISESELKAVRECMNAADADIKQPLRNMNPDCNEQDFQRNENQGLFIRVQDNTERQTFTEANEGLDTVYTQEGIFDHEQRASLMQVTQQTSLEGKEAPRLESVHIKEEAPELEPVHIKDEAYEFELVHIKEEAPELEPVPITGKVSKENKVNILEDNVVQLGSSHCVYCPPELVHMKHNQSVSEDACSSVGEEGTVLGSIQVERHTPEDGKEEGAMPCTSSTTYRGRHNFTPAPPSDGKMQHKKHRESSSQDEYVKKLRTRSVQNLSVQDSRPLTLGYRLTLHPEGVNNSATQGNFIPLQTPQQIPSEQILYQCGTNFSDLGNLKAHQQIHKEQKPHHCTECGKSFRWVGGLTTHQRIHTGEKPYLCTECGKSFIQKCNLHSHQRIHTGAKPYLCPQCGKSFSWRNYFRIHLRIHTGEKPFECAECGKRFVGSNYLKRHRRVHRDLVR
ncbi:zinc finger protein 287-like isoform X2 [Acipenser ruthenus]|uniref:zinc finger protein 287-like isoform X2 n=1 Tax=Acipenser ruthenus TaxID=7906 RepID=UPI0027414D5A|nr:zinc finger protein 287-like isoform X2 [Acipenser ruthenus]XP_058874002.1 zinc finger protein 287-like isoform X2 [Acipenser ruthenus]